MKKNEYIKLVKALHTAKVEADKAKALTAQLKMAMAEDNIDRLEAGEFIVTIKAIEKHTIDYTALKAENPELCAKYAKTTMETRLNLK